MSIFTKETITSKTDENSVFVTPQAYCRPLEAAIFLRFLADANCAYMHLSHHTLKSIILTLPSSSSEAWCVCTALFMNTQTSLTFSADSVSLCTFSNLANLVLVVSLLLCGYVIAEHLNIQHFVHVHLLDSSLLFIL